MGYTVPKDCQILVNVWAIHRDPNIWDDPLSFKPERFIGSNLSYKGNDFGYLPFGSGRRMCPGERMASKVILLTVASLIVNFDWFIPHNLNPNEINMEEKIDTGLHKKEPLHSSFNRVANLGSPVKESSLVTYAINEVRSKFPKVARIIRHTEKLPFDERKVVFNCIRAALFARCGETYDVHHHLEARSSTSTSTIDPLHDSNDSLVVMWIYLNTSPKLVNMIIDDSATAHGVWKRLTDIFHGNKDARVILLDNEIHNMALEINL
nr:probable (S)-N-methylcoclaurine 3'-hydroxylase isozyme 2 [Tanacetum cinerariifolium]